MIFHKIILRPSMLAKAVTSHICIGWKRGSYPAQIKDEHQDAVIVIVTFKKISKY
jgi:hypothetical protein